MKGPEMPGSRITSVTLIFMAAAFIAGCGQADTAVTENEHHHPDHKPFNLKSAVEEIQDRWTERKQAAATFDQTQQAELEDIIGWIPELAADSDLSEEQWLTACEAAAELQTFVTGTGEQTATDAGTFSSALQSLQSLVEAAGKPTPEFHHHHDHDHDHDHDHEEHKDEDHTDNNA